MNREADKVTIDREQVNWKKLTNRVKGEDDNATINTQYDLDKKNKMKDKLRTDYFNL